MQNLIALVVGGIAVHALLTVLCCRFLLQTSLTFWSAFKATALAWLLCVLIVLALPLLGIRMRVLSDPVVSGFVLAGVAALQVAFLAWLGRTVEEESIGLRQALIATLIASLLGYAAGWLYWKNTQSDLMNASSSSAQAHGLSPLGQLCVKQLAGMLSDAGGGSSQDATRTFMQSLEQQARTRGIPIEQALKLEVSKLGAQPPASCRQLQ